VEKLRDDGSVARIVFNCGGDDVDVYELELLCEKVCFSRSSGLGQVQSYPDGKHTNAVPGDDLVERVAFLFPGLQLQVLAWDRSALTGTTSMPTVGGLDGRAAASVARGVEIVSWGRQLLPRPLICQRS